MINFFSPAPRFKFYNSPKNYLLIFKYLIIFLFLPKKFYKKKLLFVLKKYLNVNNIILLPQARFGIYLAVKFIIDRRKRNEIIVSPYTIHDVINMIICAGGKPVFVDIDPVTMNIDPNLVSKKVTNSTAAILITHLHGMSSDMKALKNISKKYNVPLIEDSAQSLDAKYLNNFLGTIGDIGVFSMGRAKNVNTFFGGFMTIKDNNMTNKINSYLEGLPYESKIKLFKRIFMCLIGDILTAKPIFQLFTFKLFKYANSKGIHSVNKVVQTENNPKLKSFIPISYKKQITDFQCFLALNQVQTIKSNTIRRLQKAKIYFEGLKNLSSISIQPFKNDKSHVYLQFPIQVKNRVEFVSFMMRHGCDVPLQHLQSANELKIFKKFKQRCPVAKKVAESVVLLPTYPAYPHSEVKENISVITKYHYLLREKQLN